jgi:hypothetical protein
MTKQQFEKQNFCAGSVAVSKAGERLKITHVCFDSCSVYGKVQANSLHREIKLPDLAEIIL